MLLTEIEIIEKLKKENLVLEEEVDLWYELAKKYMDHCEFLAGKLKDARNEIKRLRRVDIS